jgi:ferredoxin-NADP reductase
MIRRALATGPRHPVRLLYGAASGLYCDELVRLARERPSFSFARVARTALVEEVERRWVDADADRTRRFFVCGVGAIVPTLRDLLRRAGYERRAVQYEKW